ncbi:hypothetical protein GVX76_08590 [[Haemophilus] felis]|nr:hypothetical protein [[Haemophilus] felis]
MKTELEEEKELLIMKGEALRMKLQAQSKSSNSTVLSSNLTDSVAFIASSLNLLTKKDSE